MKIHLLLTSGAYATTNSNMRQYIWHHDDYVAAVVMFQE